MEEIKEKTITTTANYLKKEEADQIREKKNLRMVTWDIFGQIRKNKTTKKLIEKLNTYEWDDYIEEDSNLYLTRRIITSLDLITWLQKEMGDEKGILIRKEGRYLLVEKETMMKISKKMMEKFDMETEENILNSKFNEVKTKSLIRINH